MKGRTPTKDEKKWLNKVGELGCIVCLTFEHTFSPCSPHHIEGRTKPGAHFKTIGLCWCHHQSNDADTRYQSVHGNKAEFEEMYGKQEVLLELTKALLDEQI